MTATTAVTIQIMLATVATGVSVGVILAMIGYAFGLDIRTVLAVLVSAFPPRTPRTRKGYRGRHVSGSRTGRHCLEGA